MDKQPATVKKVLVKKVKVLVKRPVTAPQQTPAPQPAPIKKIVKAPAPTPVPAANIPAPQHSISAPNVAQKQAPIMPSQSIDEDAFEEEDEGQPLSFKLPKNILNEVEKKKKFPAKFITLYIYARIYAEEVAKENGYIFPEMMIDLPTNEAEAIEILEEIDDTTFEALLDDFVEMSPFISGLERIIDNPAPLEKIVKAELRRAEEEDDSIEQQIILSYLMILLDMQSIQYKLDYLNTEDEIKGVLNEMKEIEDEEKEIKMAFTKAIERKKFPVDAKRLVTNYFNLAKKDPEKAYQTLITNPLFFSPIQREKLPRKMFGLVKPSAKDAIAVNKKLASFLKHLKA